MSATSTSSANSSTATPATTTYQADDFAAGSPGSALSSWGCVRAVRLEERAVAEGGHGAQTGDGVVAALALARLATKYAPARHNS
jgi:hypothetical protein